MRQGHCGDEVATRPGEGQLTLVTQPKMLA